jgi:hypothetical protein
MELSDQSSLRRHLVIDPAQHVADKEFAGIILWLLATEQEAHVWMNGWVEVRDLPPKRLKKRRLARGAAPQLSAAEAKRLRKMAKRIK